MRNRRFKGIAVWLSLLVLAAAAAGCGTSAGDKSETAAISNGAAEAKPAADAKASFTAADTALTVKDQAGGAEQKNAVKQQAGGAQPASKPQAQAAGAADNASSGSASGFMAAAGSTEDGLNRKLIYKASLTMKVKDYGAAQSEIRDLVTLAGGYILQFSENSTAHELGGQFILKIPAGGFSSFLKDLDKIPVLANTQRNVQGQDVSEEYVDLESRLKAKQILETRYLEFMQKATKTDELVSFTNELGKIQEEIERIKGRMRYIDQNVSFSTVEIRVYQPEGKAADETGEEEKTSLLERAGDAMGASFGFLSRFGQGLVVLVASLLPLLAVLAVVGVPGWLLYRRGDAKRKAKDAREQAERLKRTEYNRTLSGQDAERQDSGDSDTERQSEGK